MKYIVLEDDKEFYDIDNVIDYCVDRDYHDRDDDYFEEWVNECYNGADIAGHEYTAYDILDRFDDLYDLESDYKDDQYERDVEDARYELEHAGNGKFIYIQNYTVKAVEEETDDTDGDDVDYIEAARKYYDEQAATLKTQEATDKENENDLMSMFLHIGA